jgi:hypothetical protein
VCPALDILKVTADSAKVRVAEVKGKLSRL